MASKKAGRAAAAAAAAAPSAGGSSDKSGAPRDFGEYRRAIGASGIAPVTWDQLEGAVHYFGLIPAVAGHAGTPDNAGVSIAKNEAGVNVPSR